MTLEEIKSGQSKVETELPIPKIEDKLEPPKETAPEPKGDEITDPQPQQEPQPQAEQPKSAKKDDDDLDDPKGSEKTFTKTDVNEIIQRRLKRQKEKFHEQLGVDTDEAVVELVNKLKGYDELLNSVETLKTENNALKEKMLFIDNNISQKRYDDVRIYFKGKEIELTTENLLKELKTHPEWLASTKPVQIGSQKQEAPANDEEKIAMRLFGVRK